MGAGRKLNLHRDAQTPSELLMNVFNLRLMSRGKAYITRYRDNCSRVICRKGVLKDFAKFTGKHLCQTLFFNKEAALRPATFLKKRLRSFPVNFAKF